jgi:opacity protein-like surface antigen
MKSIKIFLVPVILFFLIFAATASLSAAQDITVRVKVTSANVRVNPNLEATVIGRATLGQELEVLEKTGPWYKIVLPPDAAGVQITGFIHESVVDEVVAPTSRTRETRPEAVERPVERRPRAETEPAPVRREIPSYKPAHKKFFVRLGGGYASHSFSYNTQWGFDMYHENGYMSESYNVDGSGLALDAGVGYFFTPNIGVELSFIPGMGKGSGLFEGGFPHPFYFEFFREVEWVSSNLKYSDMELNLNVLAAFDVMSKLRVYIGGGGTYFLNVQVESLKNFDWSETGYPYFDVSVSPIFSTYSQSCFGFNAGGGLDYMLSPSLAVNTNVRYSSGEAKVDIEGLQVTLKPGGLRATAGIKLLF